MKIISSANKYFSEEFISLVLSTLLFSGNYNQRIWKLAFLIWQEFIVFVLVTKPNLTAWFLHKATNMEPLKMIQFAFQ